MARRRTTKSRRRPVSIFRLSHWARSDVGRRREINEDFFVADSGLGLYLVADGMGGHAGGSTASRLAAGTVRSSLQAFRRNGSAPAERTGAGAGAEILQTLDRSVREASATIFNAASEVPDLEGMGTTLTALVIDGKAAHVAHVGDSRLYRLRDGRLEQLTDDHSLVNEQVRAGFITAEEAAHSRFRNIITRSVGFETEVTPDTFSFPLEAGDLFLLCSDGLNSMISDEQIRKNLEKGRLDDVCTRLVAAANRAGGEDNITAVAVLVGRQGRQRVLRPRKAS